MGVSVRPTNPDADLWESLTRAGIQPDSATAIVSSHRGLSDADLWERLTKNGAAPDAATAIVKSRQPQQSMAKGVGRALVQGATYNFGDELGLTNRGAEKAFQQAHPIADFLAKMAGGVV